ncbi:MAG: hypothetical protein ACYDDC_06145 [Thermoplasmataceae archaeon]
METEDIIKKYNIRLLEDGRIQLQVPAKSVTQDIKDMISAQKPKIVSYLQAIKTEEEKLKQKLKQQYQDGTLEFTVETITHFVGALDQEITENIITYDEQIYDILKWELGYFSNDISVNLSPGKHTISELPRWQKEQQKEQRKKQIFEIAKQTGERQLLERYSTDCNDPEEECNIDIVQIFAMPDGTQKVFRTHTY